MLIENKTLKLIVKDINLSVFLPLRITAYLCHSSKMFKISKPSYLVQVSFFSNVSKIIKFRLGKVYFLKELKI